MSGHDSAQPSSRAPDHATWTGMIAGLDEPSILAELSPLLRPALRIHVDAEDIWQETLMHAWRDRARFDWSRPEGLRAWLLTIARHRICNVADHHHAARRGGRCQRLGLERTASDDSASRGGLQLPAHGPSPSRCAQQEERADAWRRALEEIPPEFRDVIRLRVFEELDTQSTANALGLGESAVKHRLRKGIEHYARALRRNLSEIPGPTAREG